MKNKFGLRTIGVFFIITSLAGLLFSALGIGFLWVVRSRVETDTKEFIDTINLTLNNTNQSLTLLDDVLELTKGNIGTLETAIVNLDSTVTSLSDSLETTSVLIGDDLKQTVVDSQTALSSAATSAELIDNTLFFLASIPFIGADYQPEVPLHTSLGNVAGNLDEIPASLESIEQTLGEAADGLSTLNTDLNTLVEDIQGFEEDLGEAQTVLGEYSNILVQAQNKTITLKENIGTYLVILWIFITGILLWLSITQINIFLQGREYLHGEQKVVNLADIQRDSKKQD
jgi:septal ring factor EnvC (AmiA/AmiB activator)